MSGDIARSNTANAATIYIGDLGNIRISHTELGNNTSDFPTVYIANSVNSFTCFRCIFKQNIAGVEGVVSISYADQVVLDNLKIQKNRATLGSMIKIQKSMSTTILSSIFKDNLCSNLPCAVSVQKTKNAKIEHISLISGNSVGYMVPQSKSKQGSLDMH